MKEVKDIFNGLAISSESAPPEEGKENCILFMIRG